MPASREYAHLIDADADLPWSDIALMGGTARGWSPLPPSVSLHRRTHRPRRMNNFGSYGYIPEVLEEECRIEERDPDDSPFEELFSPFPGVEATGDPSFEFFDERDAELLEEIFEAFADDPDMLKELLLQPSLVRR